MRIFVWSLWMILITICKFDLIDATETQPRNISNSLPKHSTKIACEGEILNLTCPDDQVIQIIRANYGRFSLLECNEKSEAWENFECMYPLSTRVMEERCQYKRECNVPAEDETFSDECLEIVKYLEVTYECRPQEAFRPTTLLESTTAASTVAETSEAEEAPEDGIVAGPDEASVTESSRAPTFTGKRQPDEATKANPAFCPETSRRGMQWPLTRVNYSAKLSCPNNNDEHLYAQWQCSSDGTWISEHPDLSLCVSEWAQELLAEARKVNTIDDAKRMLQELNAKISRAPALYGGDTTTSIGALDQLIRSTSIMFQVGIDPLLRNAFAKNFTSDLANAANSLLETSAAWYEMPIDQRVSSADQLLSIVESTAVLAASAEDPDGIRFQSSRIGWSVIRLDSQTDYSRMLPDDPDLKLEMPQEAIPKYSGATKISMVSLDSSLGAYLTSPVVSTSINASSNHQLTSRYIASKLLSLTFVQIDPDTGVARSIRLKDLEQPIVMTFVVKRQSENASKTTCVYWEPIEKAWSTDGCSVKQENHSHVVCACGHSTTFAVLMDVYGAVMSAEDHLALVFITYIGCIVSIVACAFAVMAFCFFRASNHSDRIIIHKNLCLCLLLAESVFLFGIDSAEAPLMCTIVAALLHYLFLAAFAWMLLEGVELYALLIEVFESERSRKKYFYAFGYGVPAIVVGVSMAIDRNSYGTERHCWLSTENYFIYSFVGPVAAVLVANLAFLTMALGVMCRHAYYSSAYRHDREKRSFFDNIFMWVRGAMILAILLGLTWTVGLLYIVHSTPLMAYAFTILNSLQGLFIFVFHVLLNQQVRKDLQNKLRRSLNDRRPWSRTPTGSVMESKATKATSEEQSPALRSMNGREIRSPTVLERLCGKGRYHGGKNGSTGPLVTSTCSGGTEKSLYPHNGDPCGNSPDDTAALSEPLTDLSSYSINTPRSLPRFSPTAPPKDDDDPFVLQLRTRSLVATSTLHQPPEDPSVIWEENVSHAPKRQDSMDFSYEMPIRL